MISITKLATAISVFACTLASVSATPIMARDVCKPNFEGNRQTIYVPIDNDNVNEWTTSPLAGATITLNRQPKTTAFPKGEFFVAMSGQPTGSYQITQVADGQRNLYLTAGSGGQLSFAARLGESNPSQVWNIDCDSCPAPGNLRAAGCVISNSASGMCIAGSGAGETLRLTSCNSSPQRYAFTSGN